MPSRYVVLSPRHNDKTIGRRSEIHFNIVLEFYVAPDRQHTITTKRILKGETGILNSRSDALIIILSQCHNDRTVFKVKIVPSLTLWRLPVYISPRFLCRLTALIKLL